MLTLSQTAGYALLAMSYMDPDCQEMVLAKDLSDQTGITKPYLSKLLYKLGQSGLINGKRGYKGGITLARPASQISVLDIANAIDGSDWQHKCVLGLPGCGNHMPCPLHDFWGKERERIAKKLRELTLKKVIQSKEPGWRLFKE